jgi:hypothetical protein
VIRPLLKFEKPWLTRVQLEAAIWQLTGTKSVEVVDSLLNLADVYAASQGPALAEQVKARDHTSGSWYRAADRLLARQNQEATQ